MTQHDDGQAKITHTSEKKCFNKENCTKKIKQLREITKKKKNKKKKKIRRKIQQS